MEQQQPHYPPPPYSPSGPNPTQEYGKPPPYFEPSGGAGTAYPQQPVGFVPPPPHQTTRVMTESHQGAPPPTVITVTQVPAGYICGHAAAKDTNTSSLSGKLPKLQGWISP